MNLTRSRHSELQRIVSLPLALTILSPLIGGSLQAGPGDKSADGLWTEMAQAPAAVAAPAGPRFLKPGLTRHFELDEAALMRLLATAPSEAKVAAKASTVILNVPMPDGIYSRFRIVESPILSPVLAAQYPELRTFLGQGVDDATATVRLDHTPAGFHAMVLMPGETIFVDPSAANDTLHYISYAKSNLSGEGVNLKCLVVDGAGNALFAVHVVPPVPLASGSTLRTYRLAMTATGEYTTSFGGSMQARNQITTTINRVTGIYETEVSIRFNIVFFNIYTDATMDPFTDGQKVDDTLLDENQMDVDMKFGAANYDVGHIVSQGGTGGYAPGRACTATKARGGTSLPNPSGDAFDVDFVAHELGHQFSGSHTFNANAGGSCAGGTRTAGTAYEPGSGTTIMAYAGVCDTANVQPHSDPFFHTASFDQIVTYRDGGGNCGAQTMTGNQPPTVNAGADYTIPTGTPFILTATGSDPDGDVLTFCWEQLDLGAASPPPNDADGPLFRSRPPTASPSRTFPQLADILSGAPTPWEKLTTVNRTLNFRVTARDNRAGGGGVNYDAMVVTVNGAPFRVTSPNGGETLQAGCTITVTWDVGGGNVATKVNILLSTDGGATFSTLAAGVPNNGSANVTLPCPTTTMARIKVEAAGNIFFDISDANFSIVPVVRITVPGDVFFPDTCVGSTNGVTLYICNTGDGGCGGPCANLLVGPITSSNPHFWVVPPSSGYPVTISPDFCFPFQVRFAPTGVGDESATLSIPSNDPVSPTTRVTAFGKGVRPLVTAVIADTGNYGNVCVGGFKDLNLTINNSGGCDVVVTNIRSSSTQFLVPSVMSYPVVVHPGDSVALPIRFQPTSPGAKPGIITVEARAPAQPNLIMVSVNGVAPTGDIRVTGSTDFGNACVGDLAEKSIHICNVGLCTLRVTSVEFVPPCPDFAIINNPFPASVSHDSCLDVVIRFTSATCGPKMCNLRITSDDPDQPILNLPVTANSPCPDIDVPPDLGFLPEVIQNLGSCTSALPFPISNKGECNLTITAITLGGVNAGDFSLSGLPSFPILLQPGHIAGEGDLHVVFAPTVLARERSATLTVTYVSDPNSGATTSVTRKLCGEGVYTGARVLVTSGGIPVSRVEKIHLQRINANRNRPRLDTQDQVMNAPLVTVIPTAPCEPFQYHREYGTVSNPIQLLPGSYQVTATAIINGKRRTLVIGFDVQTCDFNPTIVIDF